MALIAALIIPAKKAIEKGEIAKYESGRSNAVYALGALVLVLSLLYIGYINLNVKDILLGMVNSIIFLMVGVGIMVTNRSLINFMKNRQEGGLASSAPITSEPEADIMTGAPQGAAQQYQAQPRALPAAPQQTGDDISVQVRLPITQSARPGAQTVPPSASARSTMKLACPKCRGVIIVDRNSRTGMIQCTHCGFTGRVG